MRPRFSSFIALAFLAALVAALIAHVVGADKVSPLDEECGTTVEENLAAAQKILQSSSADPKASLACLIKATAGLNEKLRSDESGRAQSGMMHMPVLDVPVKPGGQ